MLLLRIAWCCCPSLGVMSSVLSRYWKCALVGGEKGTSNRYLAIGPAAARGGPGTVNILLRGRSVDDSSGCAP